MEGLRIGNKKTRFPVIQGGMGIGISLGRLAGTVAKEGGAGVISAAQIGFQEPDFEENTKEANLRAIRKEYEKARKISPDGIIGFNLMVAMRHYEEYARAAAETGADFIVSGAGLPTDLPEIVKGYDVKLAPIVSTEKSAKVILKYWDKKHGIVSVVQNGIVRKQIDLHDSPEYAGHEEDAWIEYMNIYSYTLKNGKITLQTAIMGFIYPSACMSTDDVSFQVLFHDGTFRLQAV